MLITAINKLVVFHLLRISKLVSKLGANMHFINNWLNNRYEVGDTAKYSHRVLIALIPEQEDSSCLQLIL